MRVASVNNDEIVVYYTGQLELARHTWNGARVNIIVTIVDAFLAAQHLCELLSFDFDAD
jgi:hypothetical protein